MCFSTFSRERNMTSRTLWNSGKVDNAKSIRQFIQDQSWALAWRPQPLVLWGPPPPSLGTGWWAHPRISPGPPPGSMLHAGCWVKRSQRALKRFFQQGHVDPLTFTGYHRFLSSNHKAKNMDLVGCLESVSLNTGYYSTYKYTFNVMIHIMFIVIYICIQ